MTGVHHTPVTLILLGLFALVCSYSALAGLKRLLRRNPERHWVATPGVIRQSFVGDKRGVPPLIRYIYRYGGQSHEGDRITPIQRDYARRERAQEEARRYPYGANVTVYVNPEDPSQSVLEPGEQKMGALKLMLGGVAGLLVVGIIYLDP